MSDVRPSSDRPVTRLLLAVTAVEALVLFMAGGTLLAQPGIARGLWPWQLTPFNAAFLGAVYLGALGPVLAMLRGRQWAPARVVVPMIGLFTLVVLAVSLASLDYFLVTSRPVTTGIWFALYAALPANAVVHLLLWRRLSFAAPAEVTRPWRRYLPVLAWVVGLYGVGLLIAPDVCTAFWPWAVDAFHGRLYSATFLAGASGLWLVSRAADPADFVAVGLMLALFGGLAVIGLVVLGYATGRIDWSTAEPWLWSFVVSLGTVTGVAMIVAAQRVVMGRGTAATGTVR